MNEILNVYEKIENIVGTKYVTDSEPICYYRIILVFQVPLLLHGTKQLV